MAETRLYCKTHDSLFKHPQVFCDRYDRLHDEMGNEPAFRCEFETIVKSLPGELVDPADLDYEAAMRPLDKFLHDDPWFPHERYEECPDIEGELVALIVRAALGGGEPAEGNGR